MRSACLILVMLVAALDGKASVKPSVKELAAITARGQMLAEYDAAAWQATDAVMATHPKSAPSGRYIARQTEAGWVVAFGRLNGTEDRFLVGFEATQEGTRFLVKSFDPEREDVGWNLAAAKGMGDSYKGLRGDGPSPQYRGTPQEERRDVRVFLPGAA
jgi:hypothetical protein